MNLNTVTGSAVELSDVAFGREFNEALVHQVVTAYLAGARQGSRAQKLALKSLAVAKSHGVKKVQAVRVQALSVVQFGSVVVVHLQPNHKTGRKKSIVKCIAAQCSAF